MKTYLTAKEAAEYLRRSPETLKAWRYHGKGPRFYRLGYREVVYDPADLEAFVEATAA